MKVVFDDIKKYLVKFDDDDIDTDADVRYINKLTKAGADFKVLSDTEVLVYR